MVLTTPDETAHHTLTEDGQCIAFFAVSLIAHSGSSKRTNGYPPTQSVVSPPLLYYNLWASFHPGRERAARLPT